MRVMVGLMMVDDEQFVEKIDVINILMRVIYSCVTSTEIIVVIDLLNQGVIISNRYLLEENMVIRNMICDGKFRMFAITKDIGFVEVLNTVLKVKS